MSDEEQARYRMEEQAALEGRLPEDAIAFRKRTDALDAMDSTLASKAPVVDRGNSLQMREEYQLGLADAGEFQSFLEWCLDPTTPEPPPMREWSFTEVTFADMLADELAPPDEVDRTDPSA